MTGRVTPPLIVTCPAWRAGFSCTSAIDANAVALCSWCPARLAREAAGELALTRPAERRLARRGEG